ncbi:MAG: tyrosine-type recombinase/integrase [Anaerolineales bacterium]|nr:tyrosine-type recombinase/integrase [Anaerolineales bacterium]
MLTVREGFGKFLIAKRADGVKKSTVKWYAQRIERFLDRCADEDVKSITIDDLREYSVFIQDEELSEHYKFQIIRVVRTYFKWLFEERWIDEALHKRLKLPKLPQPVPKAISMNDVKLLLGTCNGKVDGIRDRTVMLFLLDTGCRVGGMCKSLFENLDLENMRTVVFEKGDRGRIVLFEDPTARAIEEWLKIRPYPENEFLFTSIRADLPMNSNSVIQMLRRRAKLAGVEGRVNPHAFRHAFARETILNGGDLATVSQMMGHSTIMTTKAYYAVFTMDELHHKHRSYSPVSKLLT